VRERERDRGRNIVGNVNCWIMKIQGLKVSDIVWDVEVCKGRTVVEMVVMVWWC
jgi:hypothetical protein